jgi:hypothetical protein
MRRIGIEGFVLCRTAPDGALRGSFVVWHADDSESHSASRLVTDTRNTGFAFSDGSISYVWDVLPGS